MPLATVSPSQRRTRRLPSARRLLVTTPSPDAPFSDQTELLNAFMDDTLSAVRQAELSPVLIADRETALANLWGETGTHISPGSICIIGSDTPHLPPAFIAEAFGRLAHPDTDLVLGPTEHGGYYLIGFKIPLSQPIEELVRQNIILLSEMRERAAHAGLRTALLPLWYTLTTPTDLDRLRKDVYRGTVIVPGTAAALGLYQQ